MQNSILYLFLMTAILSAACSEDRPPSPIGPSPTSCRTYATSYLQAGTVAGLPINDAQTCSFNEATNQLTCTLTRSGASGCGTSVATYPSKAAFVDEVRVVPPLTLMTSYTVALQNVCGGGGGTVTYSYDGQRQTGFVDGAITGTYTNWDSSGRPTAGTLAVGGISTSQTITYNDATRTATTTSIGGGSTTTQSYEYDTRGIVVRTTLNAPGVSSTSTVTTNATGQVCK